MVETIRSFIIILDCQRLTEKNWVNDQTWHLEMLDSLKENPEWILYAVIGFSWLEFGWEAYLGSRQRKIYKEHTKPPPELKDITDEETFEKARVYALDKSK